MQKMAGIYKITSPSGKVYIGQSWDIEARWYKYRKSGCRNQHKLQHSFNKHGVESHKFEVLYVLPGTSPNNTQYHLDVWEQFLMDEFRSEHTMLLNIREGGSRGKIAKETGRKISLAKQGKPCREDVKRKISATLKKYTVPQEVRERMVRTRLARPKTEKELAVGDAISRALKGRAITPEWRKKISETLKRRNAEARAARRERSQ